MTFFEFVDAVNERLSSAGARPEGREAHPISWISFTRAGCLYRLRLDQPTATINLERGQGSFIVNTPTTWRQVESRPYLELESALPAVDELLLRFAPRV